MIDERRAKVMGVSRMVSSIVLVMLTSCSTSSSSSSASAEDAGAKAAALGCDFPNLDARPRDGGVCPSGCVPSMGLKVDSAKNCLSLYSGCAACFDGCGGAPEPLICYRHVATGQLVRLDGSASALVHGSASWARCTYEEDTKFTLPACN